MEVDKLAHLEGRKFIRFKDSIFIFCDSGSDPSAEFKTITQNISGGGAMLETERQIRPGRELKLEIYQPAGRRKKVIFSIPVLAKVVWNRKIERTSFEEGENKYRMGLKFLDIKDEDRQRIVKYVEESVLEK